MAKYLKKYNEKTGKWEIFSPTSTDDVNVSNTTFNTEETPTSKLTDVLNNIGEDIEKLKRNVSWLAEHGGSGGGIGTGGSGNNYKIIITTQGVTNDTLYVNDTAFTVSFKIYSNTNEKVKYLVTYDGSPLKGNRQYIEVNTNTTVVINVKDINMVNNYSQHLLMIEAMDADGMTIPPYQLNVVETSISVEANDKRLSIDDNGTFNIFVTNKVIGSQTSVLIKNESIGSTEPYVYTYENKQTSPSTVPVNFFNDLMGGNPATVGATYKLSIIAQFVSPNDTIISSKTVYMDVDIIGSEVFVIKLSGIDTEEEYDQNVENGTASEFFVGGNINFSFTPYLKGATTNYYAIRMHRLGDEQDYIDVAGDIDADSVVNYKNNNRMTPNYLQSVSIPLNRDGAFDGVWIIRIKCWSSNGRIESEVRAKCKISQSDSFVYPLQVPYRGVFSTTGDTLYGKWNINDSIGINSNASEWKSIVNAYLEPGETKPENTSRLTNILYVKGTNGVENGFIKDTSTKSSNVLRLSNEAYAHTTIDIYKNSDNNWARHDGFTISLTFKTDKHPYNNRTVLSMGDYDNDASNDWDGIKIDLEKIYWKFNYSTNPRGEQQAPSNGTAKLTVPIKQNTLTTVDFVYERKKNNDPNINGEFTGLAKIFVNGKIYTAIEADTYVSRIPNDIYLGCCHSEKMGNKNTNFADVNIYSFMVFSKALNDMEIVINSHNNRAERDENNNIIVEAYDNWKKRNYFKINDTNIPQNDIYRDLGDGYNYTCPDFYLLKASKPPIPIMWLESKVGSGFNREYFFSTSNTDIREFPNFNMYYYDANSEETNYVLVEQVSVSLQGTSTLYNRVKNLEIYLRKPLTDEYGDNRTQLFQPKDDWFPESQFTLKADIVDSAHANNATIGRWINTVASQYILEDTPPMSAVKNNPPIDMARLNGENIVFKNDNGEQITHTPRVKHTLEGFQFILMITFDGDTSPTMLGIYSFNLGRASYYNMGLRFLKSYSKRKYIKDSDTWEDHNAPCTVDYYEPYGKNEKIGDIKLDEIFSYEFNGNGDVSDEGREAWSQSTLSIIKHLGEFKFNGKAEPGNEHLSKDVDDNTWGCLQEVFNTTANIDGANRHVQEYISNNNGQSMYVETEQTYNSQKQVYCPLLVERLSIKNAMAYYVIANAFGMVDSLGKNLTLRTWNANPAYKNISGYNKWYTCFYDMDTALGLTNQGNETVPTTAHLDSYENAEIQEGVKMQNTLIVKHNNGSGFAAKKSLLWNILRAKTESGENNAIVATGAWEGDYYEDVWATLRQQGNGPLRTESLFVDEFKRQTDGCGELVYNADYTIKYLSKFLNENTNVYGYGDINMLHGDRIEYIRQWLKDRFCFLDGAFALDNTNKANTSLPYYEMGSFSLAGHKDTGIVKLTYNVTSPTILNVSTNGSTQFFRYMLYPYKDTPLYLPDLSGEGEKILTMNSTSIITKLDGIKDNQFRYLKNTTLPSFSSLDLEGVDTLNKEPIDFNSAFVYQNEDGNYTSDIRKINLRNTKFANGVTDGIFNVNLSLYNKITEIDISKSCVNSITLPSAPLTKFLFSESNIEVLEINSQPYLTNLNFDGCSKLKNIVIKSCHAITDLDLSNLPVTSVTISDCDNLKTITCTGNTQLLNINIEICPSLTSVDLTKCNNKKLDITLQTCDALTRLNLSYTQTSYVTIDKCNPEGITYLNLSNCSNLTAFKHVKDKPHETFNDVDVLDLTPFINLKSSGLNVKNCASLKYIKFNNTKENPFVLTTSYFQGCVNLKRIFGNFVINGQSVFENCTNFYIREEVKIGEITQMPDENDFDEAENGYVTNINLADTLTSLSKCFYQTNCNLYDVYYILQKCKNITSLANTFEGCGNVKSNFENCLNVDLFKNCGKVTNMTSLFYRTNIGGVLKSPTIVNGKISKGGLLTPCYSLTSFNNTFNSNQQIYIDDKFFYKCKNAQGQEQDLKISVIRYFNPYFLQNSNDSSLTGYTTDTISEKLGEASSSNLLTHLSNLEQLEYSFSKGNFYFNANNYIEADNVKYYYTDLFYNNTKLKYLTMAFRGSIAGRGTLRNLFGGYKVTVTDDNHFPKNLQCIRASFIFYNGEGVNMFIGNSFLQKIKGSIEYISTESREDLKTTPTNTSSFVGDKLNKYIDDEYGENKVSFPYEIFNGCTKLKEVTCLFRNIQHYGTYSGPDIVLPMYENSYGNIVSMFKDTKGITDIPYLFSCMKGFKYRLSGGGFKTTSELTNVEGLFASSESSRRNGNIKGCIPYGLFLQEASKKYNVIQGLTQEMADKLEIDKTYGIENCQFDYNGKVIVAFNEEGKIVSGKTYPDNSLCPYEIDEKGIAKDGSDGNDPIFASDPAKRPVPTDLYTHTGNYKTINPTIQNMSFVFGYSSSEVMEPYTCNIKKEDISKNNITGEYNCPDLVIDNEKYNPIRYYINPDYNPYLYRYDETLNEYVMDIDNYDPRRVIENPNYNKYKKKWNKWVSDGSNLLPMYIRDSSLYEEIKEGINNDLPEELPDELKIDYIPQGEPRSIDIRASTNQRFKTRKYLCAPDIFRYCKNSISTNITKAFFMCGGPDIATVGYSEWDTAINYGLYGTVPPHLFEPVNNVQSLNEVFRGVQSILPYKWGTDKDKGVMYSEKLLKGFSQLTEMNGTFRDTRVYNKCVIPDTLFYDATGLSEISELFKNTLWGNDDDNTEQISEKLFSNNEFIKNVSGMFESSDDYGNNRFPRKMCKIFNPDKHKYINNCSSFLLNATKGVIKGSEVPEFWKWVPPIDNKSKCFPNTPDLFSNLNVNDENIKPFLQ